MNNKLGSVYRNDGAQASEILEFSLVRDRHQVWYAGNSPNGHIPTDISRMRTSPMDNSPT